MNPDEAVSRYLRDAPDVRCPDEVLARLKATIAGEVELRRVACIDPDHDTPELKTRSPRWEDDRVHDTLRRHPGQGPAPWSG